MTSLAISCVTLQIDAEIPEDNHPDENRLFDLGAVITSQWDHGRWEYRRDEQTVESKSFETNIA
jgi:hypothetical protein